MLRVTITGPGLRQGRRFHRNALAAIPFFLRLMEAVIRVLGICVFFLSWLAYNIFLVTLLADHENCESVCLGQILLLRVHLLNRFRIFTKNKIKGINNATILKVPAQRQEKRGRPRPRRLSVPQEAASPSPPTEAQRDRRVPPQALQRLHEAHTQALLLARAGPGAARQSLRHGLHPRDGCVRAESERLGP